MNQPDEPTTIYRITDGKIDSLQSPAQEAAAGETAIGYLLVDGGIYRLKWGEGHLVGRFDVERRIFRRTAHGERELGAVAEDGTITSAGLFAGGDVGWVNDAGVVVQSGLILGEEEIGRVEGPNALEAAGALLLLFLSDEREAEHRQGQRDG